MNHGGQGQDLERAQIGAQQPQPGSLRGAGAVRTEKEGELQGFLIRLQKQNARLNELILMQRDAAIRISGINPVEEPQPCDTPEATGLTAEINYCLVAYEELLLKLNQLTDRWLQL